jgi:rhomboid protease GluP
VELVRDEGTGAAPWDIFALAVCGALRGRPGFHVVPRLPNSVVLPAVQTYLALEPGELVLGVYDNSSGARPAGGCALTSRRVCWFNETVMEDPAFLPVGDDDPSEAEFAALRARLSAWSVGYARLPETVSPTRGGRALDLGGGAELSPEGMDGEGFAALAGVLETLGRGARTADLAGSVRPEALEDARKIVGLVGQLSDAVRKTRHEGHSFLMSTRRATPAVLVTPVLVAACVCVFTVMCLSGVSLENPDAGSLYRWGAMFGFSVATEGQFWRLLTATFLHGGVLHLAFNMWCLAKCGPLIERLYGHAGFVLLYIASGLGGSLVSAWWHPLVVGVGASGAIFGVIGGLLAFLFLHRAAIPPAVLAGLRASTLSFVGYNLLFGFASTKVDNAAHLGGLATGFVAGLVLSPAWPPTRSAAGRVRLAVRAAVLAAGLAVAGYAVNGQVRRNPEVVASLQAAEAPARAYNAFMASMRRQFDGFESIDERLQSLVSNLDANEANGATARRALDDLIREAKSSAAVVASVAVSDPDLEAMRRAFTDAQAALLRELTSLRRFLDAPDDQTPLDGPDGLKANMKRRAESAERFRKLAAAYTAKYDLRKVPARTH